MEGFNERDATQSATTAPTIFDWLSEWHGFDEHSDQTPKSQVRRPSSSDTEKSSTKSWAKPRKPPKPRYNVLPQWWLKQHVAKPEECPARRITLKDCGCGATKLAESLPCISELGSYMMHEDLYMETLSDLWRFMDPKSITCRSNSAMVVLTPASNEPLAYLDTVVENLAFDLGAGRVSFGPVELADFASDLFRERLFEASDGSFLQLACKSDDEENQSKWLQTFVEWWDMNDDMLDDTDLDLECGSESSDVTDVDALSDSYSEGGDYEEYSYDDRPGLSSWDVCYQRSIVLHRLFRKFLSAVESKRERFGVCNTGDSPCFKSHQSRYSDVRPEGLIIHVRELDRLRSHKIAGIMIAKLERLIEHERRQGNKILLVGTVAGGTDSPYSAWGLSIDEVAERQLPIMGPACRRHQANLRAAQASWIRTSNTRLLKSMFRSGIVAARELELFQPSTNWPLAHDSILRHHLGAPKVAFNVFLRIVTLAEAEHSKPAGIRLADLELAVRRIKSTASLQSGNRTQKFKSSGDLTSKINDGKELEEKAETKVKGEAKDRDKKDKHDIASWLETNGEGEEKKGPASIDLETLRADCNKHEAALLDRIVEARKLTTTMEDVELDPAIIEALEDMTMLPLQQPNQFKYGVLGQARMAGALLFGPPGAGKTLLARAVAQRRNVHVLEISGADVHQKYIGEGEKYVRAIFSLGRKLSPCVVFIDEADNIFRARSGDMHQAYHNVINQFLREWDGLSTSTGTDIIMLLATNRPFDIDPAVLRRLPRRLFVDLPSCRARQKILEIMLRDEQLADSVDLPSIAIATDSFSGSDLKNLCIAAALCAVREGMKACESEKPIASTTKRILTRDHFAKALAETSSSTDTNLVAMIRNFNQDFGRKAKWRV